MRRYIGLVHRGEGKKGRWGVSFPDFPGCIAVEDSFEDAVDSAAQVLRFHVEGMLDAGEPIPEPRAMEAIVADPRIAEVLEGAVVTLVPLLPPREGAERVNVSLDKGLLRVIDAMADAVGSNRSQFLAEAARDRIERGIAGPNPVTLQAAKRGAKTAKHGRRRPDRREAGA
jgi:predicted RNase H-like HicB family nuclease